MAAVLAIYDPSSGTEPHKKNIYIYNPWLYINVLDSKDLIFQVSRHCKSFSVVDFVSRKNSKVMV